MDRGQGAGTLYELDELVVVTRNPLLSERAGQCRQEGEELAGGVDVEDRGTRGTWGQGRICAEDVGDRRRVGGPR